MQATPSSWNTRELLTALYVGLWVFTPIAGAKVVSAGLQFGGGVLFTGLALTVLDLANNTYGKQAARRIVVAGTVARALIFLLLIPLLLALPTATAAAGLPAVLGQGFRNFAVGEVSNFIALWFVGVPLFDWLRRRGWFIWRYNASNLASIFVSTTLFIVGAYAGVPGVNLAAAVAGQFVVKLLLTLILTPFASGVARLLKPEVV